MLSKHAIAKFLTQAQLERNGQSERQIFHFKSNGYKSRGNNNNNNGYNRNGFNNNRGNGRGGNRNRNGHNNNRGRGGNRTFYNSRGNGNSAQQQRYVRVAENASSPESSWRAIEIPSSSEIVPYVQRQN